MKSPRLLLPLLLLPLALHAAEPTIAIDCTLGKKGGAQIHFPTVTAKASGQPVTLDLVHDIPSRIKPAPPGYPANPTQSPVRPRRIERQSATLQIHCRAELLPDHLIRLTGTATYSEPAPHSQPSPPADPKNTLSPTAATSPVIHTSTTPFQLFARPGQPYTFPIAKLKKQIPLTITCTLKP